MDWIVWCANGLGLVVLFVGGCLQLNLITQFLRGGRWRLAPPARRGITPRLVDPAWLGRAVDPPWPGSASLPRAAAKLDHAARCDTIDTVDVQSAGQPWHRVYAHQEAAGFFLLAGLEGFTEALAGGFTFCEPVGLRITDRTSSIVPPRANKLRNIKSSDTSEAPASILATRG